MGRAAYPRDLTQRFARSARLRDGAGPAVADGPAAARGQRTAFGNLWAGCASTGPAVPDARAAARGRTRCRVSGPRIARGARSLRARREPLHRTAPGTPAAGVFTPEIQAATVGARGFAAHRGLHVSNADEYLGKGAGPMESDGAGGTGACERAFFAGIGHGPVRRWRQPAGRSAKPSGRGRRG